MKTIRTKVYSFNELSETAKQTAIEKLSLINVEHDWWNFTYDDAKRIGLKLNNFDLDRNKHCTGNLIESGIECASLIIKEHGKECDTYKLAQTFINEWNNLVIKFSDGIDTDKVTYENEQDFDNEADELEKKFTIDLLECYANILQGECDYLQTEAAIKETIEANDYQFLSNGNLFNL